MKVHGDFNNIPEHLKAPKLKPKEIVHYRFYDVVSYDFFTKKKVVRQSTRIPTKDTIMDPKTGKHYDIGVFDKVQKVNGVDTIYTKPLVIKESEDVYLQQGNILQEEGYEFLEISNFNKSNPNRDSSIPALFERIDRIQVAKANAKKIDDLGEALFFIKSMSESDVREWAAAMGKDEKDDIEFLWAEIKESAKENPVAFVKFINEPTTKDKALVKYAETAGILKYNMAEHKMHWANDTTIAKLERKDGNTYIDDFMDWINVSKNGPDVLTQIRKKNKAYIKEKTAEPVEEMEDTI